MKTVDTQTVNEDRQAASSHHRSRQGRIQGEAKRRQKRPSGQGKGEGIVKQSPSEVLLDLCECGGTDFQSLFDLNENSPSCLFIQQNDVCRIRGRIHSSRHSNTNIRFRQSNSVVDAIANHDNRMALLLQLLYVIRLVERTQTPNRIRCFDSDSFSNYADNRLSIPREHINVLDSLIALKPLQHALDLWPDAVQESNASECPAALDSNINKRVIRIILLL
mmetsp:Transcript_11556/g.21671  ORF Transcript_11556/g.21671 Transcript_11556/m.21671 type:complete len:220 (-) Transcript_11556:1092-1751(-)